MTTIVRSGDIVYSDSCYGAPVGTERSRVYGSPKFYLNPNKTVLVGFTGNVPSKEACDYVAGPLVQLIEQFIPHYLTGSTLNIVNHIEGFFDSYKKVRKSSYSENFILVFFTKNTTLQVNIRISEKHNRVAVVHYGSRKELAFGSGAVWWLGQPTDTNKSIEEKFSTIYKLDNNSGGTINKFDLNKLKEIGK